MRGLCETCAHRSACELWANDIGETLEERGVEAGLNEVSMEDCPQYRRGGLTERWPIRALRAALLGLGVGTMWVWWWSWRFGMGVDPMLSVKITGVTFGILSAISFW